MGSELLITEGTDFPAMRASSPLTLVLPVIALIIVLSLALWAINYDASLPKTSIYNNDLATTSASTLIPSHVNATVDYSAVYSPVQGDGVAMASIWILFVMTVAFARGYSAWARRFLAKHQRTKRREVK